MPVGSGCINILEQYGARTVGTLAPSCVGIRSISIDPAFRGKSYGTYMFEHMHAVGFSNPEVERIVLDVMTSNFGMLKWVVRMGYVEVRLEDLFEVGKVPQHMLALEPVGGYKAIYSELTREKWLEMQETKRSIVVGHVSECILL